MLTPKKRTYNTYRKDGNAPLSEYSPRKKTGSGNLIPAGKKTYGKVSLKGAPKKKNGGMIKSKTKK